MEKSAADSNPNQGGGDRAYVLAALTIIVAILVGILASGPSEYKSVALPMLVAIAVILGASTLYVLIKLRWRKYRDDTRTKRAVDNNISTLCQLAAEFRHIIDPDKSDTISYAIVMMNRTQPLTGKLPAYAWPFFSTSMETILHFSRKGMRYSDFKQLVEFLRSCDRDFNDRIQESAKIIKDLSSKGLNAPPEYYERYRTARISYIGFMQRLVTFRSKVNADLGLKTDDQNSLLALPNLYHDPPIEL